jgi:dTDP-4-amino-4,6-dideoxygalactose transaminase
MLAPVGNSISLNSADAALPVFDGYEAVLVNSGTAALTLALRVAKQQAEEQRTEVIIPAYACPDLITASAGAGVTPVLCDIGAGDPGYELEHLKSLLSERTLAVIAVNFLGIRDRLDEIDALANHCGAVLIEDDAQWYPEDESLLRGAMVITSFGRGKPASIHGGGALLVRDEIAQACNNILSGYRDAVGVRGLQRWQYLAKVVAYNICLNPSVYGLVARLPGLAIGATVYKPPQPVTAMPATMRALLAGNIERYLLSRRAVEQAWREQLDDQGEERVNLPVRLSARAGRMLRYPLLLKDKAARDEMLEALNRQGLGGSAMYQRPLTGIQGVPLEIIGAGSGGAPVDYRNAAVFADRMLTLPVHEFVMQSEVMKIRAILEITTKY